VEGDWRVGLVADKLVCADMDGCGTRVSQSIPRAKSHLITVKNGFSKLTEVKIGQDQHRIDIMNDHWEKALKEGCCEREQAQMDVSSIEKTNTKYDLARAMAKSRSEMQTVANGHVGQKANN